MTFDPQKPRYVLPLAGKNYQLEGNFAVIEACEVALKDHIFNIMSRCTSMPSSDMSKLIAAILQCHDEKITAREVGDILWDTVGTMGDDYIVLCLHVHAFLRIMAAKPVAREEVAKEMGELVGKWINQPASHGNTTDSLPSAL